jgi:hypothetical protein
MLNLSAFQPTQLGPFFVDNLTASHIIAAAGATGLVCLAAHAQVLSEV